MKRHNSGRKKRRTLFTVVIQMQTNNTASDSMETQRLSAHIVYFRSSTENYLHNLYESRLNQTNILYVNLNDPELNLKRCNDQIVDMH